MGGIGGYRGKPYTFIKGKYNFNKIMGKNSIKWIPGFFKGMLLGGLSFGFLKLVTNNEVNQEVKSKIFEGINQSGTNKFLGLLFTKTLDDLTPMVLGFFPLLGYFQIFTMAFFIWIGRKFLRRSQMSIFKKLLWYIALLFTGYFIGTIILYITYFWVSGVLGLTILEAWLFLRSYQNGFDNVIIPILIGGSLSIFVIYRLLTDRK